MWSKQRALRSTKVQGVQESGSIEDGSGWDSLKGSNTCTLRTEWNNGGADFFFWGGVGRRDSEASITNIGGPFLEARVVNM